MFPNKSSYEIIPNKLFEGIEENKLNFNIEQKNFLYLKEGEAIYQNIAYENFLYLIIEGEIKIKIIDDTWGYSIIKKSKGDFFGIKKILDINLPAISAVAITDSVIYKLDNDEIKEQISNYSGIKKNIIKSLTGNNDSSLNNSVEETQVALQNNDEIIADNAIAAEPQEKISEDDDKLTGRQEFQKDGNPEELKFENMDLLYENIPGESLNRPHKLNEFFKSVNSFLKFLSADINYLTGSIDSFLIQLENKSPNKEVSALANAAYIESGIIKNYITTVQNFFENNNDLYFENVSFNENMDYILTKLAEYTGFKKINIFKKFDDDCIVKINKDQFYLACFQIIKNWCRCLPDNGNIYITTKKSYRNIEIKFKDDKVGIPDDILKNIFEPPNNLDNNEIEFGLILANKIINNHCGKISVSKSKELNSFIITLPLAEKR